MDIEMKTLFTDYCSQTHWYDCRSSEYGSALNICILSLYFNKYKTKSCFVINGCEYDCSYINSLIKLWDKPKWWQTHQYAFTKQKKTKKSCASMIRLKTKYRNVTVAHYDVNEFADRSLFLNKKFVLSANAKHSPGGNLSAVANFRRLSTTITDSIFNNYLILL